MARSGPGVLSAPPPLAQTKSWKQKPQMCVVGGESRRVQVAWQREGGSRLPIMGTSAMKTLRIELATLRNENQTA